MAYEKQDWKNGKEGETPLNAERLNHMEEGISSKAEKGEKGETGAPGKDGTNGTNGAKGATGANGADGKDGFPTEVQWNALIARVEALENLEA